MPIIGTVGTLISYVLWILFRHILPCSKLKSQKAAMLDREKAKQRVVSMLAVMVSTCYTLVISSAFTPFDCVPQRNGQLTMRQNPSQFCGDSLWRKHLPMVLVFLFCYGLGIPVGVSFLFLKNRKRSEDPQFRKKFKLLINSYRSEYYFWELVNVLKRALFFLLLQLWNRSSFGSRFMLLLSLLSFFLFLDVTCRPYATSYVNSLAFT